MPVPSNQRHELFAQALFSGKTLIEAYSFAGYKPDASAAHRLSKNVHIQARIRELQERAAVRASVDINTIHQMFLRAFEASIDVGRGGEAAEIAERVAKLFGVPLEAVRQEAQLLIEDKRENVVDFAEMAEIYGGWSERGGKGS